MSEETNSAGNGSKSDLPITAGGLVGAVAYLLAYLATYVLVGIDDGLDPAGTTEAAIADGQLFEVGFPQPEPGTFEFVGWILTNAQFVDTVFAPNIPAPAGGDAGSLAVSLLSAASTQIPELVYRLVPVVLLGAGGYLLARRYQVTSSREAIRTGGTVLVGYLPLSVVGGLLFAASQSGEGTGVEVTVTASPQLGLLVVTALVFPVLFGASGAMLALSTE